MSYRLLSLVIPLSWAGVLFDTVPVLEVLTLLLVALNPGALWGVLRLPRFWLPWLVFLIGALLAFMLNTERFPDPLLELYMVVHCGFVPVLLFVIAVGAKLTEEQEWNLVTMGAIFGAVFALGTLAWLPGSGFDPIGRLLHEGRNARFEIPGSEASIGATTIAFYVVMSLPAAASGILSVVEPTRRLIHIGCLIVITIALAVLGTRFAWLSAFVSLATMTALVTIRRYSGSLGWATVCIVAVVSTTIGLAAAGYVNENVRARFAGLAAIASGNLDESSEMRLQLWSDAWIAVHENPWGIGWRQFAWESVRLDPVPSDDRNFNTHSEWLLLPLAAGWIGAAGFTLGLLIIGAHLLRSGWWKPMVPRQGSIFGLGVLVAWSVCALFDNASNHPSSVSTTPAMMLWLGLAVRSVSQSVR